MEPQNTKATGVGAQVASQNTSQDDYAPSGNLIQAHIDGERIASAFLDDLRSHFADPDTLFHRIAMLHAGGKSSEALATLRGFCRKLQKRLETASEG